MSMVRWKPAFAYIAALIILHSSSFGAVYVIVNSNSPLKEMNKSHLKKVFMNRRKTWKHGGNIHRMVLSGGPAHKEFCERFLGKSPAQFQKFWLKIVFTGFGIAPNPAKNDETMIQYISENQHAIGYVSEEPKSESVRVLQIRE